MNGFAAEDEKELLSRLNTWGHSAPGRLERRGRKKELERWIVNRFLRKLLRTNFLTYPVQLSEAENPDFFLSFKGHRIGLEVTEAVSEDEQKEWTRHAKEDRLKELAVRLVGEAWATTELYPSFVANAINRKAAKASASCDQLLIYLNTHDDGWDAPGLKLAKITDACTEFGNFRRVWVLSDGDLLELVEKCVIHEASTSGG